MLCTLVKGRSVDDTNSVMLVRLRGCIDIHKTRIRTSKEMDRVNRVRGEVFKQLVLCCGKLKNK